MNDRYIRIVLMAIVLIMVIAIVMSPIAAARGSGGGMRSGAGMKAANLVGNAIKHTRNRADITITLSVLESNGNRHCRVSVEDNGPGIPDEKKAILFDPETPPKQRDGMGLYLVTTIVSEFNGRVLAEDRMPGDYTKGLRVIVLLPAAKK